MRAIRFLTIFAIMPVLGLAARADETPKRKPGLWEINNKMAGMPAGAGPIQTCIGAETDNLIMQGTADMRAQCSKMETRRSGADFLISSVCKMGSTTATTEGKFTGNFDSAYHADMHITYDPPIHGMSKADMTLDAKWLGPCKEGQKAGDITMPGMPQGGPKSINMEEMMKMRDQMMRKR
jgi:hypothetical protein